MPELIENAEDVSVSVAELKGFLGTNVGKATNIDIVKRKIDDIRHITMANPRALATMDWSYFYNYVGAWALRKLGDKFDVEKFCKMLVDKNHMYGPGPILSWGNLGVAIRLHSKIERYDNLKDKPESEHGSEALNDTLSDIVGYCVLGMKYDERFKDQIL